MATIPKLYRIKGATDRDIGVFDSKTGMTGSFALNERTPQGIIRHDLPEYNKLPEISFDEFQHLGAAYGLKPNQVTSDALSADLRNNLSKYIADFNAGNNPITEVTKGLSPVNPQGAVYSVNGQVTNQSPSLPNVFTPEALGKAPGESWDAFLGAAPPQVNLPTSLNSGALSQGASSNFQYSTPSQPYPVAGLEVPQAPKLTQSQGQAQDLINRLQGLNSSLEGRSAYQTQQNQAQGVDTAQRAITDLGAQLTGIKNEAAAIPLQLQQGAAERGVTTPLLGAQQNSRLRTNAIAALGVSTLLAAAQGQLANAQSLADKAVAQKYDPIDEQIRTATNNLNLILNSPQYDAEQKAQAQAQLEVQRQREELLASAKANESTIQKIAIEAASNINSFTPGQYQGASQALQAIQNAGSPVEAMKIMAQSFPPQTKLTGITSGGAGGTTAGTTYKPGQLTQLLQSQGKPTDDASLANLYKQVGGQGSYVNDSAHNSQIYSALSGQPTNQPSQPEQRNAATLSDILNGSKVSATAKTQLGRVLGVIKSAEELAVKNPSGDFTGVNPINTVLNAKIPFTNIGIPFRDALKQQETTENEGYINAIKLAVGYWASGATLTAQQLELVDGMTPTTSDTDARVRDKLNTLVNFMNTQASATLQSEGIDYSPERVDLFETSKLLEKASKEEIEQLKNLGLLN